MLQNWRRRPDRKRNPTASVSGFLFDRQQRPPLGMRTPFEVLGAFSFFFSKLARRFTSARKYYISFSTFFGGSSPLIEQKQRSGVLQYFFLLLAFLFHARARKHMHPIPRFGVFLSLGSFGLGDRSLEVTFISCLFLRLLPADGAEAVNKIRAGASLASTLCQVTTRPR